METCGAPSLRSCCWNGLQKSRWKAGNSLHICCFTVEQRRIRNVQSVNLQLGYCLDKVRQSPSPLEICQSQKFPTAPVVELQYSHAALTDNDFALKKKSNEVLPYLKEMCIYLVGMMGSGKTTVGRILAEVLGYSFCDSDKLVEQAVGASSVSQIFEEHNEAFFRDNESKVLENLSKMRKIVVATGGGAVVRPINWRYMKRGITVWLDVPLEALAARIAAVGTDSRPLLNQELGDPYTKALMRLTSLFEERGRSYAEADTRVCLNNIATKQGHGNASALTPTAIALETLGQIGRFLGSDFSNDNLFCSDS